jgi:hypothetical protein
MAENRWEYRKKRVTFKVNLLHWIKIFCCVSSGNEEGKGLRSPKH